MMDIKNIYLQLVYAMTVPHVLLKINAGIIFPQLVLLGDYQMKNGSLVILVHFGNTPLGLLFRTMFQKLS